MDDYQFKARKSSYDGEMKAQMLGTRILREYVTRRRRQEAEPSTINKELARLRRAMNLGFRHEPQFVSRVPSFEMLPVDNVREGTINHNHYRAVRDSLPTYARIAVVIARHAGARKDKIRAIRKDKSISR